MKVIVHPTEDGNIAVTYPAHGDDAVVMDASELPQDRDFRNAWVISGQKVVVDFERAKEITKARLRAEREPLFAAQDTAYLRALQEVEAAGEDEKLIEAATEKKGAAVTEAQRLRDVTTLVDAASTLDELRALKAE